MPRYAVIGAGAGGLSAARELQASGIETVVFEARNRPGGRAFTDYSLAPHAVELGAEFLHGERISTWDWVREFDARTTGEAHSYRMWFHLGDGLIDAPDIRRELGTDPMFALERMVRRWNAAGKPDASLDSVFEHWPEISDKPLTAAGRRLLDNYISELAASDVDQLGTFRSGAGADRGLEHFRLIEGYTKLMLAAARGLEIRYEAVVERIRWDERSAEVQVRGASPERFDGVVVALPLGVLRGEGVEFDPPLPARKRDAIARINTGAISKIVLLFDEVRWLNDFTFLWTSQDTQLWWRPGQGQPNEAPVLTAFFGGRMATSIESASAAEAAELAVGELSQMLGRPMAQHLKDSRYIAWSAEPHTLMGYSSLPVGGAGLREALGEPAGVLHFAGEATSLTHPATIDGAIDSGRRAAAEIIGAG